jgi:hypothetical protein
MALATLSIDLEARLARLEGDLSRATRSIEREAGRMEKAFVGASGAIKNVAALLGSGVAATWLIGLARDTIAGIDALNDLSDATGASIENLSALEDAAARVGTEMGTVGAAIIKLNQQLALTERPGSQAAEIFKQLGLNAEELKRIDPAEALLRTAQALQGFADDGNKARLIQVLFGKSVAEVAPLLKDLAEQGKLNASVTQEQADQVDRFNKSLAQLSKGFTDLSREIVSGALPSINLFIERLTLALKTFGGLGGVLKQGVGQLFRGETFTEPGQALQFYSDRLKELDGRLKELNETNRRSIYGGNVNDGPIAKLRAEREEAQKLANFYRDLNNLGNAGQGRGDDINPGGAARPSVGRLAEPVRGGPSTRAGATARAQIFGPEIPDAVADAIKRIEGSDETKLQRLRDTLQQLAAIVSAGGTVPDSVFSGITDEITRLDPAALAAADSARQLADAIAQGKALFAETRTPAEVLAGEIERLNVLLQQGAIDWDTYARAQFAAQDRFDAATGGTAQAAKELDNTARDLGLTFSSAFEDAIVDGEKFGDVLRALDKDLTRILTRRLITEPLADGITGLLGGGGGGGDFFSSLISKAGSLFSGFFAEGGFVPPGRWGIAGERGPEPVFGGRTGATVQPAGGQTIVVNVQAVPGMSRQTAQQQGEQIGRGIRMATMRNG